MRAAANIGKIFTGAWQLMGFTFFCEALRDNPSLIERVFERVAAIQTRLTERVIAHPVIGARRRLLRRGLGEICPSFFSADLRQPRQRFQFLLAHAIPPQGQAYHGKHRSKTHGRLLPD